jgi:acyl-[acyl-carrier-protein] desaturase
VTLGALADLTPDLTPTVARLLDRHLTSAREWFPHELVPWERAHRITPSDVWDPADHPGSTDGVRRAVLVNLLTEDNLPYYTRALTTAFGSTGPWGEWICRWTAEEGRHAIVLRDWVTVTGFLDPVALERARMQQVSAGVAPVPWSTGASLVYLALQELATRVAHHNTAKALDDPAGYEIMKRVAADENLHFLFYRDLASAAIELEPSQMVSAIERVVKTFAMPGVGIDGFRAHTMAIADAGIYSLSIFHDQVLNPILRTWQVDKLTLDGPGSKAQADLLRHVERVRRVGERADQQRDEAHRPDR